MHTLINVVDRLLLYPRGIPLTIFFMACLYYVFSINHGTFLGYIKKFEDKNISLEQLLFSIELFVSIIYLPLTIALEFLTNYCTYSGYYYLIRDIKLQELKLF